MDGENFWSQFKVENWEKNDPLHGCYLQGSLFMINGRLLIKTLMSSSQNSSFCLNIVSFRFVSRFSVKVKCNFVKIRYYVRISVFICVLVVRNMCKSCGTSLETIVICHRKYSQGTAIPSWPFISQKNFQSRLIFGN